MNLLQVCLILALASYSLQADAEPAAKLGAAQADAKPLAQLDAAQADPNAPAQADKAVDINPAGLLGLDLGLGLGLNLPGVLNLDIRAGVWLAVNINQIYYNTNARACIDLSVSIAIRALIASDSRTRSSDCRSTLISAEIQYDQDRCTNIRMCNRITNRRTGLTVDVWSVAHIDLIGLRSVLALQIVASGSLSNANSHVSLNHPPRVRLPSSLDVSIRAGLWVSANLLDITANIRARACVNLSVSAAIKVLISADLSLRASDCRSALVSAETQIDVNGCTNVRLCNRITNVRTGITVEVWSVVHIDLLNIKTVVDLQIL